MEYAEILRRLAPCGLDCGRCADWEHGEIKELSARLVSLLGEYGRVAAMKAQAKPQFAEYPDFEAVLASFAAASCSGCRGKNVQCPIDSCRASVCLTEKAVDFCFECPKYPCPEQFAEMASLRKRWMAINDRMREIGVERFYEEQRLAPRYPGKKSTTPAC